jgi:hypothetical protein
MIVTNYAIPLKARKKVAKNGPIRVAMTSPLGVGWSYYSGTT